MNFTDLLKARIQKWLVGFPYFVFLLPLFFVLHGLNENFGYVRFRDGLQLWLMYSISILIFFGLFFLLFKRYVSAAIITFYLFCIFFFYGVFQDFLAIHANFLNRYSLWLPFFLVGLVLLLIYLKGSKNDFSKGVIYLNLLFILLITIDVIGIFTKSMFPGEKEHFVYPPRAGALKVDCPDCRKPDVYLLLFDEYASSAVLKNQLGFDNSDTDSFLVSKNFRLQPATSGNYNNTVFSMSSILNMSYVHGINPERITGKEYALCKKLLLKNAVSRRFASMGYEIINLSFFDIEGAPAPIHSNFLPSNTDLITGQTLLFRLHKHLYWHLVTGRFEIHALNKKDSILHYTSYSNNHKILDSLAVASNTTSSRPRFFYAHFIMPHSPFLFDSTGKLRSLDNYRKFGNTKEGYLNNLLYTNKKLKEIVALIQQNTKGKDVIIVMGDHGYRSDSLPNQDYFKNFNAVYLPPGYHSAYYDSITGVNQFRVLFNTLFKANYPLLKDSTVFLVNEHDR